MALDLRRGLVLKKKNPLLLYTNDTTLPCRYILFSPFTFVQCILFKGTNQVQINLSVQIVHVGDRPLAKVGRPEG